MKLYRIVANNPVNAIDPMGLANSGIPQQVGEYTVRVDNPHVPGQRRHAHIEGGDLKEEVVINQNGTPSHGTKCEVPKNKKLRKFLRGKGFALSIITAILTGESIGDFVGEALASPIGGVSEAE